MIAAFSTMRKTHFQVKTQYIVVVTDIHKRQYVSKIDKIC